MEAQFLVLQSESISVSDACTIVAEAGGGGVTIHRGTIDPVWLKRNARKSFAG